MLDSDSESTLWDDVEGVQHSAPCSHAEVKTPLEFEPPPLTECIWLAPTQIFLTRVVVAIPTLHLQLHGNWGITTPCTETGKASLAQLKYGMQLFKRRVHQQYTSEESMP